MKNVRSDSTGQVSVSTRIIILQYITNRTILGCYLFSLISNCGWGFLSSPPLRVQKILYLFLLEILIDSLKAITGSETRSNRYCSPNTELFLNLIILGGFFQTLWQNSSDGNWDGIVRALSAPVTLYIRRCFAGGCRRENSSLGIVRDRQCCSWWRNCYWGI